MRPKKFLTLLFVVIVQFCYGQEYHKIVDTNKVWSIIDEYTAGGGQPYSQFIKFTTDTLIGSYNYTPNFVSINNFMIFLPKTKLHKDSKEQC